MKPEAYALPDKEGLKPNVKDSYCYITISSFTPDICYQRIENACPEQRLNADLYSDEPGADEWDQRKEQRSVV